MKILCDTHILIWLLEGNQKLTENTRSIIEDASSHLFFSAASVWEAEIKKAKGKLVWPDDAAQQLIAVGFELVDIQLSDVIAAARLAPLHGDPFDRMIIAQAKLRGLTLVSHDRRFASYGVAVLDNLTP